MKNFYLKERPVFPHIFATGDTTKIREAQRAFNFPTEFVRGCNFLTSERVGRLKNVENFVMHLKSTVVS